MKKLLVFGLLAMFCVSGFAQTAQGKEAEEEAISNKIHLLRIYYDVLPVLFTKEELKTILPAIEKAKDKVRQAIAIEADTLKPLSIQIDEAMKRADDKSVSPPRELILKINGLSNKLFTARSFVIGINVDDVYTVVAKTLTTTQIKIISNSVIPAEFGFEDKPDKMTQEDKVRMYVRQVLLDPLAYPILVKLSL